MRSKILNRGIIFSVVILWGWMLAGCTERELSERPSDGVLKVRIEWPERAEVEGTRLLLYRSDGTLHSHTECGPGGHEYRIPAGTYMILAANTDCENAGPVNHEDAGACCMYAEAHPTEAGAVQNVRNVYSTGKEGIIVRRGNRANEVTLCPQHRVKYLRFDIDPSDAEGIRRMQLRMTGAVPSVRLADGGDALHGTQDVLAEAVLAENEHYTADMSVFGWRGNNSVTAGLTYTDGSGETSLPQDIGEQLSTLPEEGGTIYLTLEFPSGRKIGLTVTVEEWKSGSGSATVI